MELNKTLKSSKKEIYLAIIGIVVSLIAGVVGYYMAIQDKEPKVVFDILSNTEVFSINQNVSKLKVLYENQNLKDEEKKLVILTIKISNLGSANIRESDYYSESKFGFTLNNGDVAENPVIIDASNKFLLDHLTIRSDSLNKIFIKKLPIDRKQSFTVKVLSIVSNDQTPTITPFGTISGTNGEFEIVNSFSSLVEDKNSQPWIDIVFRYLGYLFLLMIVIMVFVVWRSFNEQSYISQTARHRILKEVKSGDDFDDEKIDDFDDKKIVDLLSENYLNWGLKHIQWINHSVLKDEVFLNKYLDSNKMSEDFDLLIESNWNNKENLTEQQKEDIKHFLSYLIENKVIRRKKERILIDLMFLSFVRNFCNKCYYYEDLY
ncbi:MAG: hypothetical protein ABJM06_08950 [Gilvibacter sp.]